ncbi:hypothetical protein RHMOL_Rhmol13G0276100 [Rhododendron molle]|uniref:Uncharacterized protein n=1 Tax=Rhododendron molle TaxID=49168 RepID=A0ACC0LBW2_RHOML|nr:hypothetical protein RHMOL_Rhmol13G0276100 [Rhododendron molle]
MANPRESPALTSTTSSSPDQPVNDAKRRRICRNSVSYCFWGLLLVWWVTLGCEYFIGRYSSPKFRISSFSVPPCATPPACPSSLFNSNWKITYLVRSPAGWDRTSYGRSELLYRGVLSISSASVSPFYLPNHNTKAHRGTICLDQTIAAQGGFGLLIRSASHAEATLPVDNIYDDLKDGAMNFSVAMDGTVRWIKSKLWTYGDSSTT